MAEYDIEAQADAAEELAPKSKGGSGQEVTLIWQASATYDPKTGSNSAPAPETQDCSGIEEQYRSFDIDGTKIKAGDVRFMLSPLTSAGEVVDLHEGEKGVLTLKEASGVSKTVVRSEPYRPAGALVYAYLQLRGAA